MRVSQPPNIRRTQRQARGDFRNPVDLANVEIDVNGDGRTGFDFAIASTGVIPDEVIEHRQRQTGRGGVPARPPAG